MSLMIASPPSNSSTSCTLQLLHLEDCVADHKLLRHCLRQAGIVCNIHWTDNLQDFTTEVSTKVFDAVIADYYLPGFTALDAWQALQQQAQARDTPFILLSGAIGETAAGEAIQQGLADYVLKDAIVRLPHVLARALEMAETRRAKAQALQDLEASRAQLAALTEHLQSSIEQERAGIAREIHDDIGGALTAVMFDVSWMVRNAHNAAGVAEHGQAALEMLQHALGASQRIMMNLRPPVLDQGLVAAVHWLTQNFSQRTQLPVHWVCQNPQMQVPAALQVVAYRTAQEALTNISKHAQATKVSVELACDADFLTLEVRDDGCGISATAREKSKAFGLRGLAERARTVGGWLDISSQPGAGTSIIVSLPLAGSDCQGDELDPRCTV